MRPGSPVQGPPAGVYGLSFLALIWLFALRLSFPKVPPLLSGLPFPQINQFSTKYVYQAIRIVYEVRTELFSIDHSECIEQPLGWMLQDDFRRGLTH